MKSVGSIPRRAVGEAPKLYSVKFYGLLKKEKEYIEAPDLSLGVEENKYRFSTLIPHLSPNRTLSEFRPFFEPNLQSSNFFSDVNKLLQKEIDVLIQDIFVKQLSKNFK